MAGGVAKEREKEKVNSKRTAKMYESDSDETYPSSEEEMVNDEDVETIKILGQTLQLPSKVSERFVYILCKA